MIHCIHYRRVLTPWSIWYQQVFMQSILVYSPMVSTIGSFDSRGVMTPNLWIHQEISTLQYWIGIDYEYEVPYSRNILKTLALPSLMWPGEVVWWKKNGDEKYRDTIPLRFFSGLQKRKVQSLRSADKMDLLIAVGYFASTVTVWTPARSSNTIQHEIQMWVQDMPGEVGICWLGEGGCAQICHNNTKFLNEHKTLLVNMIYCTVNLVLTQIIRRTCVTFSFSLLEKVRYAIWSVCFSTHFIMHYFNYKRYLFTTNPSSRIKRHNLKLIMWFIFNLSHGICDLCRRDVFHSGPKFPVYWYQSSILTSWLFITWESARPTSTRSQYSTV